MYEFVVRVIYELDNRDMSPVKPISGILRVSRFQQKKQSLLVSNLRVHYKWEHQLEALKQEIKFSCGHIRVWVSMMLRIERNSRHFSATAVPTQFPRNFNTNQYVGFRLQFSSTIKKTVHGKP